MSISVFKLSIWKPCSVSSSCFLCTTQSQYSCYLKKSRGNTDDIRWWECIILWMSLSFPGWNIRLHGSVNYYQVLIHQSSTSLKAAAAWDGCRSGDVAGEGVSCCVLSAATAPPGAGKVRKARRAGGSWGLLQGTRQRGRGHRDICAFQTPLHSWLRSFQPCQPRCEWWALNPKAHVDLCYWYHWAENQRGKEGQPLLPAVTLCVMLKRPCSVQWVSFGVNFFIFPSVYLIFQTINSLSPLQSAIRYLHRA